MYVGKWFETVLCRKSMVCGCDPYKCREFLLIFFISVVLDVHGNSCQGRVIQYKCSARTVLPTCLKVTQFC